MVTAATATIMMGADLSTTGTAPADKTMGEGNSFAKSFGEQTKLLIGDDAQPKFGWPPGDTPSNETGNLKMQAGVELKATVNFLSVKVNGVIADGTGDADAVTKPDSKPVQQAAIPSVPHLPQSLLCSSTGADDIGNPVPVAQGAMAEAGTAIGEIKPPSVETGDQSVPVQVAQTPVAHVKDPTVPEPSSEMATSSDPKVSLPCGQVGAAQQEDVKDVIQVAVKGQAEGQISATTKTSAKFSEKKEKTPAEAGEQTLHVQAGDTVIAAVQPIAATISPAALPVDVVVPAASFVTARPGGNKGTAAGKGSLAPSANQQSGAAKQATEGKNSRQDMHSVKVETAASKVAATLLVSGAEVASKPGQQMSEEVVHVVNVDGGNVAKPKEGLAVTQAKEIAGSCGVSGGVVSGAMSVHGAAPNILTKVQGGDGAALGASAHSIAVDASGAGAATQQAMDGAHRTLEASPTTLEIGVPNGTEGWVKVRAEMASGGGVNASLSAASPAGQEMLHRELPSLTAYLQQERVAVNTVVVHQPASAVARHDPAGSMGGGVGQQAQQRHGQGGDGRQPVNGFIVDERTLQAVSPVAIEEHLPQTGQFGGMSWLSVRV